MKKSSSISSLDSAFTEAVSTHERYKTGFLFIISPVIFIIFTPKIAIWHNCQNKFLQNSVSIFLFSFNTLLQC